MNSGASFPRSQRRRSGRVGSKSFVEPVEVIGAGKVVDKEDRRHIDPCDVEQEGGNGPCVRFDLVELEGKRASQ